MVLVNAKIALLTGGIPSMSTEPTATTLFSFDAATDPLGGTSAWTLRKHAASGSIRTVRIGRRVFIPADEISRIQREGLPSLGKCRKAVEPGSQAEE